MLSLSISELSLSRSVFHVHLGLLSLFSTYDSLTPCLYPSYWSMPCSVQVPLSPLLTSPSLVLFFSASVSSPFSHCTVTLVCTSRFCVRLLVSPRKLAISLCILCPFFPSSFSHTNCHVSIGSVSRSCFLPALKVSHLSVHCPLFPFSPSVRTCTTSSP